MWWGEKDIQLPSRPGFQHRTPQVLNFPDDGVNKHFVLYNKPFSHNPVYCANGVSGKRGSHIQLQGELATKRSIGLRLETSPSPGRREGLETDWLRWPVIWSGTWCQESPGRPKWRAWWLLPLIPAMEGWSKIATVWSQLGLSCKLQAILNLRPFLKK